MMYVKCLAVVAAVAMAAVGTSALTAEEREVEVAKLMAQLNSMKTADVVPKVRGSGLSPTRCVHLLHCPA